MTETRTVVALFVWPNDADAPELALAWDELDVDENPAGWQQARTDCIAGFGDDLRPELARQVRLSYDGEKIDALFMDASLSVDIE